MDYLDERRREVGIEPICRVLTDAWTKSAPSTYYNAKTLPHRRGRCPTRRPPGRSSGCTRITSASTGVRKVHTELRRQRHPVARCTVASLMRAAGLRGISRAKGPRTTVPDSAPDTRPDLVDRTYAATAPNRFWVAYCRTFAG